MGNEIRLVIVKVGRGRQILDIILKAEPKGRDYERLSKQNISKSLFRSQEN